jgi:hypothetical protein
MRYKKMPKYQWLFYLNREILDFLSAHEFNNPIFEAI